MEGCGSKYNRCVLKMKYVALAFFGVTLKRVQYSKVVAIKGVM